MDIQEKIDQLENTNTKLLILVGYAIGMIGNMHLTLSEDKKYNWLKEATDALVYQKKQWPVMP
jgi:hypothetical protein